MTDDPLVKGGQSRDADDVRFDASVVLSLLAFALLLVLLVAANLSETAQ